MDEDALQQLREQLLIRWQHYPREQRPALESALASALVEAAAAEPELITVAGTASRSQRLRLTVLVSDRSLDKMYQQEWAELSVSSAGRCYFV